MLSYQRVYEAFLRHIRLALKKHPCFGGVFPHHPAIGYLPHFKKPPYVWHIFGIGILFDMLYSELNLVELYDWLQMLLGSAGAWLPPANGFHVSTAVGQ